ncbi:MAG: DUF4136 domain-containing protein [Candidatus Acidiferrales bacterium]
MIRINLKIRTAVAVAALAVLFGIAAAPASVFAQDIRTNAMPGTDFSKFKTYTWVSVEGAKYPNQILDAQIKQSIDQQMASKGFTKTDGPNADLDLAYQVSLSQQTQWNAYGTGGIRWGGGMATATQSTINTGTLVLDMYDPSKKTLVWQGSATKTVNPGNSSDKIQKNLDNAMKKLLKNFPPQAK